MYMVYIDFIFAVPFCFYSVFRVMEEGKRFIRKKKHGQTRLALYQPPYNIYCTKVFVETEYKSHDCINLEIEDV